MGESAHHGANGGSLPSYMTPEALHRRLADLETERKAVGDARDLLTRLTLGMEEIRRDLARGATRMTDLERQSDENDEGISAIKDSVAALELSMTRQLNAIAMKLPVLSLTSNWTIALVSGVFGIFAALLIGLGLKMLHLG